MTTATSDPAKLAIGIGEKNPIVKVAPNVIARIAPREAPAETPSVNGVARGLRKRACSTTPAVARALPTSAAANVRGRRATKKI